MICIGKTKRPSEKGLFSRELWLINDVSKAFGTSAVFLPMLLLNRKIVQSLSTIRLLLIKFTY